MTVRIASSDLLLPVGDLQRSDRCVRVLCHFPASVASSHAALCVTAAWDSVITCFFVDTAKNIIEYVEAIARLLKPGGVWINFGPLLYHWTDMPDSISLEISYQELRDIIVAHGFRIEVRALV